MVGGRRRRRFFKWGGSEEGGSPNRARKKMPGEKEEIRYSKSLLRNFFAAFVVAKFWQEQRQKTAVYEACEVVIWEGRVLLITR